MSRHFVTSILCSGFCSSSSCYYLCADFIPQLLSILLNLVMFGFTILFIDRWLFFQIIRPKLQWNRIGLSHTPPTLHLRSVARLRHSWIFCLIDYIFGIVYLLARGFDFKDFGGGRDCVLLGLALSIMSFGFMSYNQEKTFRIYYKSILWIKPESFTFQSAGSSNHPKPDFPRELFWYEFGVLKHASFSKCFTFKKTPSNEHTHLISPVYENSSAPLLNGEHKR